MDGRAGSYSRITWLESPGSKPDLAIPAELFQGKRYGTIFGTLSLASIVGGAIGPWVAGALHDYTGSYVLAFWIAIGATIVSAVAMWLAAPRKVRAVAGRVPRGV